MESVSLYKCGVFEDTLGISKGFRWQMACRDYFHLGNRKVYPILKMEGKEAKIRMHKREQHSPHWLTALKIMSYFTVVLPFFIGLFVLISQRGYKCHFTANRLSDLSNAEISNVIRNSHAAEIQGFNEQDCILNGLYLGNGHSFLDCTGLEDVDIFDDVKFIGRRETNNPLDFQHVVSMCPLANLADRSDTLANPEVAESKIKSYLQKTDVNWMYVGRSISDLAENDAETTDSREMKWLGLVFDTTCPKHPLSAYEPFGKSRELCEENFKAKQEKMKSLKDHPETWFEQTFKVLDKAVFEGQSVLVHCSEGRSRSAALVIAYLINRFKVTADEAIRFVKSKRPCVDIRFEPELKEYETLLRER